VKGLVFPVALVALAQLGAIFIGIERDNLAAPADILVAFGQAFADGTLLQATAQTLWAAIAGLALGGGIGLLLAILLGLFEPVARLLQFPIETFRPIPSIALLPIALLVFGFGFRMEVAIVAFSAFWPIVIIGHAAIAGIEPLLIDVSRSLGLSFVGRVVKVVLPAALPRIFVAFRFAAGIALIVAVTVEIAANPLGLGHELMSAQQSLQPALMFATLVWIGIIGWSFNAALLLAQRRLFGRAGLVEERR
jgi:ABC-type nitrate/sulfonate/bicarbonate transport system permease component